jgi:hypothetical protein
MKRVIAAGFVLLLTAGTAFAAANTSDTQGSFLDRAASFFGLRPKNPPAPVSSVPSGRTALYTPPQCTCVTPRGLVGVPSDPNDPNSPCVPLESSRGVRYQAP